MPGLTEVLAERLANNNIPLDSIQLEEPDEAPAPASDESESSDNEAKAAEGAEVGGSEAAEGAEAETGATESEGDDIHSLVDLAKHLEVDPEFLYGLKIKLSDTGEEISIGKVKDKLQEAARLTGSITAEREALAEERTALANSVAQMRQVHNVANEAVEKARGEMFAIDSEFRRINWAELEKIDPGRAALEQTKFMQRYAAAKGEFEQAQGQQAQQFQQAIYLAKQHHDKLLLDAVPEWKDPERVSKDINDLVVWARSKYKFSDDELGQTLDWRHRDILRKAWLYDKAATERSAASSTPPMKPLKKGVTLKKPVDAAKVKEAELVSLAKRSGKTSDKVRAAAAILARAGVTSRKARQ
jgi:hypothetical protein